jgi:hypothetical protein
MAKDKNVEKQQDVVKMFRKDAPTPAVAGGCVAIRMPFDALVPPGQKVVVKMGISFDRACLVTAHRRLRETYPLLKLTDRGYPFKPEQELVLEFENTGSSAAAELAQGDQVADLIFFPDVSLVDA